MSSLTCRCFAGFPSLALAGILTLVGTLALVSVIVDLNGEIDDHVARMKAVANKTAARVEFGERNSEGDELARQLKAFRYVGNSDQDGTARLALGKAVGDWNDRCVATAKKHLGVPGNLESPYPVPNTQNTRGFWRDSLLSEVTAKLERLYSMQVGFM